MRSLLKYGLIVIWLASLITPPIIFIQRNTVSAFTDLSTIFPFFGLLAFTLVWSQIMLGSFMRPLEKLYPKILPIHIVQGLATFFFAGLHWLLNITSFLPDRLGEYLAHSYVSEDKVIYLYFGLAALMLLAAGVLAGLLRNWAPVKRYWHWIHLVHYLVFFIAFIHSINLGTDVQYSAGLNGLWYFFLVTVIIGIVYRRIYIPSKEGLVKSTS